MPVGLLEEEEDIEEFFLISHKKYKRKLESDWNLGGMVILRGFGSDLLNKKYCDQTP